MNIYRESKGNHISLPKSDPSALQEAIGTSAEGSRKICLKALPQRQLFLEDLLDKTDSSIYKLVILATKRALEIAAGAPGLVEADANAKPTSIALKEIAEGKVKFKKAK